MESLQVEASAGEVSLLQPVAASVAAKVNAAARERRCVVPGTARAPRSDGRAPWQNGHALSDERTWRWHEGQGTSDVRMRCSESRKKGGG